MTVTRYEYDDSGRLVRSVSVPEREWLPEDVALLMASRQDERSRGSHGFLMAEATDPNNEYAFEGPKKPSVDFAEKARLDAQAKYYKRYDTKDNPVNRNGHIWRVSKKEA